MSEARVTQLAVEALIRVLVEAIVTQVAVEVLMPRRRFVPQIIRRR